MVMRSSLDPLEEARARIRLRHARAKPVAPAPKTIGTLSQRITRDRVPDKGPAIGRLKLIWAETVGAQIAHLLPTLLKKFHTDAYKQVLMAGAMRPESAGLKAITFKHLALASQSQRG